MNQEQAETEAQKFNDTEKDGREWVAVPVEVPAGFDTGEWTYVPRDVIMRRESRSKKT